ncbi:CCC motif membrane protein [Winogradskyella litorisediminis]|uniref:CCC motif membrane protein n=1 Tax=Winogradskyella litorisediminis TaxID=1156618 RepID=A0ABW3N8C0_9FLAO
MEQRQLPNATLVLVMGILSIVGCCCYGAPGLIFGIIAIVLAGKATKVYQTEPEMYTGYGNVKAGKIMGIIGVVLSILMVAYLVWIVSYFGWETLQDQEELQRKIQEMMGQ